MSQYSKQQNQKLRILQTLDPHVVKKSNKAYHYFKQLSPLIASLFRDYRHFLYHYEPA